MNSNGMATTATTQRIAKYTQPTDVADTPVAVLALTCVSPAWLPPARWITYAFDCYRFGQGRLTRQRESRRRRSYVPTTPAASSRAERPARTVGAVESARASGALRIKK
jgi:hypothetical protein